MMMTMMMSTRCDDDDDDMVKLQNGNSWKPDTLTRLTELCMTVLQVITSERQNVLLNL